MNRRSFLGALGGLFGLAAKPEAEVRPKPAGHGTTSRQAPLLRLDDVRVRVVGSTPAIGAFGPTVFVWPYVE